MLLDHPDCTLETGLSEFHIQIQYKLMLSKSKISDQIKQISYSCCNKSSHESEPLSRICIDKQCKNKTLICALCEEELHNGHETVPLKFFLKNFYGAESKKAKTSFETHNELYYVEKLNEIRESYLTSIDEFQEEMNSALEGLKQKGERYFSEAASKLFLFVQLQNPLEILTKETTAQDKIKKYFENIIEKTGVREKFILEDKLNSLVTDADKKYKNLNVSFNKLKNETNTLISQLSQSLNTHSTNSSIPKFTWSEELKGAKMKITDLIAEQTGMESGGQRFIMMQPSLTEMNATKICWGIQIVKLVGWIGIGICLKNVISNANFFFNYSNINHGSYMISNNGYSWSHSVLEFNSAHKSFHFVVGDTIYVEYDKINKKLKFQKGTGTDKFELSIVDPPPGDSYHPCANICSTGDTIQIINTNISLN